MSAARFCSVWAAALLLLLPGSTNALCEKKGWEHSSPILCPVAIIRYTLAPWLSAGWLRSHSLAISGSWLTQGVGVLADPDQPFSLTRAALPPTGFQVLLEYIRHVLHNGDGS